MWTPTERYRGRGPHIVAMFHRPADPGIQVTRRGQAFEEFGLGGSKWRWTKWDVVTMWLAGERHKTEKLR